MASIKKRVNKNAQNQPPEFKLGSWIIHDTQPQPQWISHEDFLEDPRIGANVKSFFEAARKNHVIFSGILIDTRTADFHYNTPFNDLNQNAEIIAIMIKNIADFSNVSVEKVLGKVMSSLYESEKGDGDDEQQKA